MIVYVATLDDASSTKILGVFSSYEFAKQRCLSQPAFTRQSWGKIDSNNWDNGYGLRVRILEFAVV